jgi:hypothetical protein
MGVNVQTTKHISDARSACSAAVSFNVCNIHIHIHINIVELFDWSSVIVDHRRLYSVCLCIYLCRKRLLISSLA